MGSEPEVNSEAGRRLWIETADSDLDALLAIDAKRTPGTWRAPLACKVVVQRSDFLVATTVEYDDALAIAAAVNALRPLIEQCKRAEAALADDSLTKDLPKLSASDDTCHHCGGPHWSPDCPTIGTIADLTRQRDGLLEACEAAYGVSYGLEARQILSHAIAAVKGGTDGKTRDFVKALNAAGGSASKLRPAPKTLGQICFEAWWGKVKNTWADDDLNDDWGRAAAAVEREVLRRLEAGLNRKPPKKKAKSKA